MKEPIKMKFYPFEIKGDSDLSIEQRIDKLRELGKAAETEFQGKYNEIVRWFDNYNQLYILSFSMFYLMLDFEGRDEEAETGTLEFSPYFMELLQAFALTIPYKDSGKPLYTEAERFKSSIKKVGDLNNQRFFNIPEHIKTVEEVTAYQLRTQMMVHTTVVRNWSYEYLMEKVSMDLAAGITLGFKDVYNFEPKPLIALIFSLNREVENRINKHLVKLRSFMSRTDALSVQEEYENVFENTVKTSREHKIEFGKRFGDVDNLKDILMMHSDLGLQELFVFDLDEMIALSGNQLTKDNIRMAFDTWSLVFNELKDEKTGHFLLSNPVHQKPFIKLGNERYFTSLWTVMTHLSISLLETLVFDNKKLHTKYNDYRARYLEEQAEQMFRKAFPGAQIYLGSMWQGDNNKLFENDLLVVIDSFALVIEAKSGMVSAPAKRGAPERLFKTLKELIEEPSEQALRFIHYLKENKGELSLPTKKGKKNVIDTRNLKFFIPLGITLSHLGSLSTNLKLLINAGVTDKKISELAPSISLTDLHIVFDLLPTIPQKLHYLQRRREIEAHVAYHGDEVDLLAWYLDSGFILGKSEYEEKNFYELTLKSKELDPYIIGSAKGQPVAKPKLQMTKWWEDILERLESTKKQLWIENSFILLNVGYEEQQLFEKMVGELTQRIKRGASVQRHNWIQLDNSLVERRFLIVGYLYTDEFFDERNAIIEDILHDEEKDNAKGILVLGINIDKAHYPYSVLAARLSSRLFDSEFLEMVNDEK